MIFVLRKIQPILEYAKTEASWSVKGFQRFVRNPIRAGTGIQGHLGQSQPASSFYRAGKDNGWHWTPEHLRDR